MSGRVNHPGQFSARTTSLFWSVFNERQQALFFLAFVPQFIDPAATHKPLAFLFLGAIFNVNGTLWCLFIAWISARFRSFGASRKAGRWLNRTVGGIFVLLGLRLALAEPA